MLRLPVRGWSYRSLAGGTGSQVAVGRSRAHDVRRLDDDEPERVVRGGPQLPAGRARSGGQGSAIETRAGQESVGDKDHLLTTRPVERALDAPPLRVHQAKARLGGPAIHRQAEDDVHLATRVHRRSVGARLRTAHGRAHRGESDGVVGRQGRSPQAGRAGGDGDGVAGGRVQCPGTELVGVRGDPPAEPFDRRTDGKGGREFGRTGVRLQVHHWLVEGDLYDGPGLDVLAAVRWRDVHDVERDSKGTKRAESKDGGADRAENGRGDRWDGGLPQKNASQRTRHQQRRQRQDRRQPASTSQKTTPSLHRTPPANYSSLVSSQ
jgi:hypothetical protein